MTDDMTRAVASIVLGQLQAGADSDEDRGRQLRQEAEDLRKQAAGLQAKAITSDAHADQWELGSRMKRQLAALMGGAAEIPTAEQVLPVGDLGMCVGLLPLTLPPNPSPEKITEYRDLMQQLNQVTLTQATAASAMLREAQATQQTGQIPPEYLPQPDPLTAAPEDSGPHPILPASPWADLIERRLALDIGETEPTVGRLTAVDPERLTVAVDAGTRAGEMVVVDLAGVAGWQALPEPQAAAPMEPAGYPEQPAVEAPPLPRRERKADYAPVPLGQAAADACGRVLDALSADTPGTGQPEPLIDPDCRDGKCGSCVGGPCEHECHRPQASGGGACPGCSAPMPGAHQAGCMEAARVAAAINGFGVTGEDDRGGVPAAGRFQPGQEAGADRAGAVDGGRAAGVDGTASGTARPDMTSDERNGADQ